jgi:hypothetical protein
MLIGSSIRVHGVSARAVEAAAAGTAVGPAWAGVFTAPFVVVCPLGAVAAPVVVVVPPAGATAVVPVAVAVVASELVAAVWTPGWIAWVPAPRLPAAVSRSSLTRVPHAVSSSPNAARAAIR